MTVRLELKSFMDLNTLVNSLAVAVDRGIISREQAQGALKDQMYEVGLLKHPPISDKLNKVESKKKE